MAAEALQPSQGAALLAVEALQHVTLNLSLMQAMKLLSNRRGNYSLGTRLVHSDTQSPYPSLLAACRARSAEA